MRFQIDWASFIVGSKFTVFALFYFVFGGLYSEGRFNGGVFALSVLEGPIHGGDYFRNFTVFAALHFPPRTWITA